MAGGRALGLSHPRIKLRLALTKSCLVSLQLQAKLTIMVEVSDGINEVVSARAWAGWLQRGCGQGSVGKGAGGGLCPGVDDADWLKSQGDAGCQSCTHIY